MEGRVEYSLIGPAKVHQVVHLSGASWRAPHTLPFLQHGAHLAPLHPLRHEHAHKLLNHLPTNKGPHPTPPHPDRGTQIQAVQHQVTSVTMLGALPWNPRVRSGCLVRRVGCLGEKGGFGVPALIPYLGPGLVGCRAFMCGNLLSGTIQETHTHTH